MFEKIDHVSGGEPDALNTAMLQGLSTRFMCDYGEITIEIGERMGLDYNDYFQSLETLMSDTDIDTNNPNFGVVKKGTIGAHILNMGVKKNEKEVVGFHFIYNACIDFK